MQIDEQTKRYAAMGRTALLPGMVYMVEQMQRLIDEFRGQLAQLEAPVAAPKKRKARRGRAGWSSDPEERRLEMARRKAVALANQKRSKAPVVKLQKEAVA